MVWIAMIIKWIPQASLDIMNIPFLDIFIKNIPVKSVPHLKEVGELKHQDV